LFSLVACKSTMEFFVKLSSKNEMSIVHPSQTWKEIEG
jgi:hypothetical protein